MLTISFFISFVEDWEGPDAIEESLHDASGSVPEEAIPYSESEHDDPPEVVEESEADAGSEDEYVADAASKLHSAAAKKVRRHAE